MYCGGKSDDTLNYDSKQCHNLLYFKECKIALISALKPYVKRMKMKKTAILILLAVTVVFFQISGFDQLRSATLLDRVVATVNGEVITWSELMNIVTLEGKEYLNKADGKEREEKIKEIESPFLNNIIESKLQLQHARAIGLRVDSLEVDGAVNEIREKFKMTDEIFMNSLKAEGLTIEDYRARLADQILIQKVVNYAVKKNIVVTDKEIDEYYRASSDKFMEKERLRLRQIFFAAPENDSQKAAVDARAAEVVRRINQGEDFAELAAEFSEDPSRHFGGDIGLISRGSVLKEIEDVAFLLKEGEASVPFWSAAGLHIIKVEEKTGSDMEKIREVIKDTLFRKEFEVKYRKWTAGLREKAYVEIKL